MPELVISPSSSVDTTASSSSGGIDTPLTTPGISNTGYNLASDIIPSEHPHRTLVLCFDGTGDQFDADNSNVVLFFSMLKKDDRRQQLVYYQAGIGTYTTPQIATPGMAKISKTLDEMVAWNLDAHVMDGYEFLMQNYEIGDKICLFGFSRGAYTARALAGMIHKVGLLPPCNHQQVPFAYKMFTRTDQLGWEQSTAFKKAFSVDVDVEFIGVWDTVTSVGLIPRTLPFTTSNTSVRTFRHAVSLDEHRAKFKANLFNRPTKAEAQLGTHPGDMPKSDGIPTTLATGIDGSSSGTSSGKHGKNGVHKRPGNSRRKFEREFSERDGHIEQTDVKEVWFAGCHCDVGGGSVSNDTRHNLARIPLRWMIRECFRTNIGIRFHASLLRTVGLDPNTLFPTVLDRPETIYANSLPPHLHVPNAPHEHGRESTADSSYTVKTLVDDPTVAKSTSVGYANIAASDLNLTEEEEDVYDALSPIYDQLSLAPAWWILELLPMRFKKQRDNNDWVSNWGLNLGQPRKIPSRIQKRGEFFVHRSVKIRMEAEEKLLGGKYVPRPQWKVEPKWVD
ncbi:unnamed protein product [Somion occarium]|uniref:T6SS Phospholipase effector Tle1-like catalytic domain-containing protein n=1 Tax=Somion occarium TaxID=3059160 RepID=A0ABP1CGA5_9APHY